MLSLLADQLVANSKEIILSLQENGGGRLRIANNLNDNKVWLEAWDANADASATEFLLTGQDGQNAPVLSLLADQLVANSKEIILSLQENGGGQLHITNNPNDNKVWLEAFDANADASATELLLSGAAGSNVPQLSFLTDTATFSKDLVVSGGLSGPTISDLESAITALSVQINQLSAQINQLSAQIDGLSAQGR